jgi:hypothetical protein
MTCCYKILGWICDFFHEYGDTYGGTACLHCSHCIQSGYCMQHKDAEALSKSLQLTNAIDARAFHESLLNKVIPSIHRDVDEWRVRQRALLIDQITSMITDSEVTGEFLAAGTHTLNPELQAWVDAKRAEITSFAHSRITNEACENSITLWALEVVIHCIDEKRCELDAITDVSLSATEIEHHHRNCLAELQNKADDMIKRETACLEEMVSKCLGELNHEAKVKIFEAKNEAFLRSLISTICTLKPLKPSQRKIH